MFIYLHHWFVRIGDDFRKTMKRFLLYILILNSLQSYCIVTQNPNTYNRVGYSTKYGYGFSNTVNTYPVSYYQQNMKVSSSLPCSPMYGRPMYSTNNPSGPRRSKERPYSGNFLEDLADWWRINTDSDWPSYVDDDYWDVFLNDYPEYQNEAEQWFEEHGQTPPWLVPIGQPTILILFLICYTFYIIKRTKKEST